MPLSNAIIVFKFLLGFCLCKTEAVEQSHPRVITPLGTIEGYYKTSNSGRPYEAYEGIPYAQPPIGESRFRAAKRIKPWTGILRAKSYGQSCMQVTQSPNLEVLGSEDCLYMNVYTATGNGRGKENQKSTNLLPVIFFVHGGGFVAGSGSEYGPKYLLDKYVILVTFNYRLGALGFLSTGDETVCGNMGLKDQVIALRWVKNNIESFGGDPSRITITGQNAGSASVHYHYLTKLTTGLFQRGLSASGTALNSWAQVECPLQKAKKLAKIFQCPTVNVASIVDCLRDKPAQQILEAFGEFSSPPNGPRVSFGPVIESRSCEFAFISRSPIDIIAAGEAHDLPWITGAVSVEGLRLVAAFVANGTGFKYLNDNWETLASYLLDYQDTVPKSDQSRVAELAREHYLGTEPISRSTFNQTANMFTDRLLVSDAGEAASLQAQTRRSPVWFYKFAYRKARSYGEVDSGSAFEVDHADDVAYVFDTPVDTSTTPEDRAMQKKMVDLWTSYATHGTPDVGVEWSALKGRNREQLDYLRIAGPSEIGMKRSLHLGEKQFWQSLGIRENKLTGKGNSSSLACF